MPRILARDGFRCLWGSVYGDAEIYPVPASGCAEKASTVDHIGDAFDHSDFNLRSLCTFHHRKRSAFQGVAARGKLRGKRSRNRPSGRHPGYLPGREEK